MTIRGDTILNGLNDVQRQAASHKDGPLVVFAGAGSGKTRIITHRIAWLIEQGVPPWEILAVTFTNKASQEMKSRVDALTPYGGRVLIATFHSACARWLREFAPELGYTSDFTIYDDDDQLKAIKTILSEFNVKLDEENSAQDYKAAINKVKTMAMLPGDERLAREYSDFMPPAGLKVYQRYQEYLAACNAMDFSDLIMNVLLLLRRNAMVRGILQKRYRYILVDEYQDTNRTQFELISKLAEGHGNLFVVGDDDQSIYSWRGAVPSNIIDFDKVYPSAIKITMEQNYRCGGHIVEAANAMIANNKHRVTKRLFTENDMGEPITYRLETDNELEAWWVIDAIKADKKKYDYRDMAIFYRTNSQSRMIEDVLMRDNIPYQIYGTVRFYDRMEIKDLMAYFRVVFNPADDISAKRVLNVPTRGIGKKAEEQIEQEAVRRGKPFIATVKEMVEEGYPRLGAKLKDFATLYDHLASTLREVGVEEALEVILNATSYMAYVEKKFPDQAVDKIENIHELGAALADFAAAQPKANLAEWLQSVTLSSSESDEKGGVSLMTLHMAKGLEYPRVFIVGLEEGLLPHKNSQDNPEALEEERRLFYVGITRAKEKLSLTGAYRRRTYNNWSANRPSRFLNEIPPAHFRPLSDIETNFLKHSNNLGPGYADATTSKVGSLGYAKKEEDTTGTRYVYEDAAAPEPIRVGASVQHPTYGKGIVEELHDEFGIIKAVVRFGEFGLRKVISRHLSHGSDSYF